MKNQHLPIFLILTVLLSWGCAGEPAGQNTEAAAANVPLNSRIPWQITDYRGKTEGAAILPWVIPYLEGGNNAVEALDEYQDQYVFISLNSGTNFNALEQWRAGFSPELDFARLSAVRMEKRFLNSASKNPDDEFGSFFETMIRTASDASWTGAVKEGDFWIKRYFPETDGSGREIWDFLVIVTVEKTSFISQSMNLLKGIKPFPSLSRDQSNAVNRILDRFFEGF